MESIHDFYAEIQALDHRQVISLYWLKRWVASLSIVFVLFSYIWSSIFSNIRDSHIPFALLSQKQQFAEMRMYYRSDAEIRDSQISKINFVIFACDPKCNSNSCDSKSRVNVTVEAIRTMKSVTLFTKKIIHFHIFTEDALYPDFISEVDKWPNYILHRVTFEFHAANYPEAVLDDDKKSEEIQKNCDLSFLFIPSIVKNLDFALYAKSGVIFLSPIDELWMNFRDYNEHNSLALPLKYYNGQCKVADKLYSNQLHPVYDFSLIEYDILRLQTSVFKIPVLRKPEFKNNSLFPLNIEEFQTVPITWNPTMLLTVYNLFKSYLTVPTVDILNIIALFNPDKIYTLPCDWNFDVTVYSQADVQCPNAKLLVKNENSNWCSFAVDFNLISDILDKLDFKEHDLSNITKVLIGYTQKLLYNCPLGYCS